MSHEIAEASLKRLDKAHPGDEDITIVWAWVNQLETSVRLADQSVAERNATIDRQRQRIVGLEHDHLVFKDRVKAAAVEHARDNEHCRTGLNAVLEELGLERIKIPYVVALDVEYESRRIAFKIEAEDEDSAAEAVKGMFERGEYDQGEGDEDDLVVDTVSVADVSEDD